MGLFEAGLGAFGKWLGDKKNREAAVKDRNQQMDFAKGLNYQPEYASNLVDPYQKTQSPVARSYLESFLMGNNPDATFSGSPDAAGMKSRQQGSQNAMFGTPQQRLEKSNAFASSNPYVPRTPATPSTSTRVRGMRSGKEVTRNIPGRRVGAGENGEDTDLYASNHGALVRGGIDQTAYDNLVSKGVFNEGTLKGVASDGKHTLLTNAAKAAGEANAAGDEDRLRRIALFTKQFGQ